MALITDNPETTTLKPPLTHEQRLNLDLWIQEESIEIHLAEKHFCESLPDDHERKIALANLLRVRDEDDRYHYDS